jgi:hypothetical protein
MGSRSAPASSARLTSRPGSRPAIAACPIRCFVLGLRQLRDVGLGIFERDELAAAGHRNRIIEGRRHPVSVVKWCQPFSVRLDFEPFPTTAEHRLDMVGAYGHVDIPMLLEEGLMIDALIWYTVWVLIVSSMVAMLIGPVG